MFVIMENLSGNADESEERWSCWESNPGPLAYSALSYSSYQQPPLILDLYRASYIHKGRNERWLLVGALA